MLEVKEITKDFAKKRVLNSVSFKTEEGEIFGLIGPNGAGKTTLLNIVSGLTDPTSGEVVLDGINLREKPLEIKKRIGLVPQELALFEDMNAKDNLLYFGGFYGIGSRALSERAAELLKTVGLENRDKEKVKKYSGGMKRRLNLAISLLHKPKLLILDEPTVGVDPQSRQSIFDYLRELNKNGTTIIYTSHYMEEVEELCNRIFIIDEGKEVAYGTQDEIRNMVSKRQEIILRFEELNDGIISALSSVKGVISAENSEREIRLTVEHGIVKLGELLRAAESKGGELTQFDIKEMTLTEVFLSLTGKSLRE